MRIKKRIISHKKGKQRLKEQRYKGAMGSMLPGIPYKIWKMRFTLRRASFLAWLYCKLTKLDVNCVVEWGQLSRDTGAVTVYPHLRYWAKKPGLPVIITMNKKELKRLRKMKMIHLLWAYLGHEIAHLKYANHRKDEFGAELMRVQDFMFKYGDRAVEADKNVVHVRC